MKKFFKNKMFVICIAAAAVAVPFITYQNKHLEVSEYTYSSEKIGSDLDGFTIVQISDLHNSSFGIDNRRLIDKVSGLSPDIIVITGDLNFSDHENIDSAVSFISAFSGKVPVYYVTGNHEYYIEDETKRNGLIQRAIDAGAVYLNNESVTISRGQASFLLAGLDDKSLIGDTLSTLINDTDQMTVVLAHEPQYLSKYDKAGQIWCFRVTLTEGR